ncbi:MAG: chemotaxis protein CheB [Bacteroidota bacterium]|nr:chemotaxis protein CheB [Bacteroidota bacterium]
MSNNRLIVIGGSAGSLHVMFDLLSGLRPGFPDAVLIVLHRNTQSDTGLEELMSAKTGLPCKEVEEKEPVLPGIIYLCPPDYHVLIEKQHTFSLDYSERVNFSRPSIDVTFKSAALAYGESLTAVLLSGANADGAGGLEFVKQQGGLTVVQDPSTAEVSFMPEYAIARVKIDLVLRAEDMPAVIFGPRPV